MAGFLRLRRFKQRDVIFRHNDLHRAHVDKALLIAQPAIVFCGVADFIAAIHHKPRRHAARKFRF